jgi:hypothetical protein
MDEKDAPPGGTGRASLRWVRTGALVTSGLVAGAILVGPPRTARAPHTGTWILREKVSAAQAMVAEAARSSPSSRIEISRMRNF